MLPRNKILRSILQTFFSLYCFAYKYCNAIPYFLYVQKWVGNDHCQTCVYYFHTPSLLFRLYERIDYADLCKLFRIRVGKRVGVDGDTLYYYICNWFTFFATHWGPFHCI